LRCVKCVRGVRELEKIARERELEKIAREN